MDIFNDLSVDPTPPVDEFDFILSQVSDDEIATLLNPTTISNTHEHPQRFAAPISDADVQEARKSAVPKNTAKNTTWAVKVWQDWGVYRFHIRGSPLDCPPHLLICSNAELAMQIHSRSPTPGRPALPTPDPLRISVQHNALRT